MFVKKIYGSRNLLVPVYILQLSSEAYPQTKYYPRINLNSTFWNRAQGPVFFILPILNIFAARY